MKLSAKSEYALRAMVDLASQPGEKTTLDRIAGRQRIPEAMLRGIAQSLARAGLVETVRGYGGGVALAGPADRISVRMVMEAVEGPIQLHRCRSRQHHCPLGLGERCPLRALWDSTEGRLLELWDGVSLAALASGQAEAPLAGKASPPG